MPCANLPISRLFDLRFLPSPPPAYAPHRPARLVLAIPSRARHRDLPCSVHAARIAMTSIVIPPHAYATFLTGATQNNPHRND